MTCNYIFETALALIGEPQDGTGTADYAQRAPYLISLVFFEFSKLSERFTDTGLSNESDLRITSLDSDYLLAPELLGAVCLSTASLLILDELPELSATLAERARKSAEMAANSLSTITYSSGGSL